MSNSVGSSPAIGSDGTVYVESSSVVALDSLYAIKPDGTFKWGYKTTYKIQSSPAIGSDGTIYVGAIINSTLYGINSDGTLKWQYNTGSTGGFSSPAISSDGTVYVQWWGAKLATSELSIAMARKSGAT